MELRKEHVESIKKAKEESGKTYDQLADELNMSKSQAQRYFTGNVKSAPSSVWRDVCASVDLDPKEIGIHDHPEGTESTLIDIILPALEDRHRKEIERLTAFHENTVKALEKQLAYKNRWIRMLTALCLILICFIIITLFLDIMNPDIGWFREMISRMEFFGEML